MGSNEISESISRPKPSGEVYEPAEWSEEKIRRIGYRAIDLLAKHVASLPARKVFQPFPQELAEEFLEEPLPQDGSSVEEVLAAFEKAIEPYPFGNGHSRFWGWVNPAPTPIGILAEALAAAMNPSCAGGNHSAIYVERQLIGWFREIFGLPPESMGLLVSGASMAALTALAVARHVKSGFDLRRQGLQEGNHPQLIFYGTQETHACHQKALELLGIGSDNLRSVACDQALRMIPETLASMIQHDLSTGRRPVAVIASAGTVNTGAIDPIGKIADICQSHNLWLHVDGAYGAPAILTGQYRDALSDISRADSLVVDPHKWLYVPVDAGLVLVRNAEHMREAFSLVPPYLRTDANAAGVGGPPWFSEYGFEQTRSFRALKVWMALKHHGISGYRRAIEKNIGLAQAFCAQISSEADFEVHGHQSLSIVCFRLCPEAMRTATGDVNALNQRLLETVQLGGEAFLSSTVMDGVFWLRMCIVNYRSSLDDISALVTVLRTAARDLCSPDRSEHLSR